MDLKDKIAVIYYSLDGNTEFVAKSISDNINADIFKLKPKKDLNKKSKLNKYFWGGLMVVMKETPDINSLNFNLEDYSKVIIGTPVWAWTFAPPFNTFFNKYNIKGKQVAMYCCSGGQKGKVFANMKKKLIGNNFIGEKEFIEPIKTKANPEIEINKWLKEIGLLN